MTKVSFYLLTSKPLVELPSERSSGIHTITVERPHRLYDEIVSYVKGLDVIQQSEVPKTFSVKVFGSKALEEKPSEESKQGSSATSTNPTALGKDITENVESDGLSAVGHPLGSRQHPLSVVVGIYTLEINLFIKTWFWQAQVGRTAIRFVASDKETFDNLSQRLLKKYQDTMFKSGQVEFYTADPRRAPRTPCGQSSYVSTLTSGWVSSGTPLFAVAEPYSAIDKIKTSIPIMKSGLVEFYTADPRRASRTPCGQSSYVSTLTSGWVSSGTPLFAVAEPYSAIDKIKYMSPLDFFRPISILPDSGASFQNKHPHRVTSSRDISSGCNIFADFGCGKQLDGYNLRGSRVCGGVLLPAQMVSESAILVQNKVSSVRRRTVPEGTGLAGKASEHLD
eukprot:CAMPEP_0184671092 /NCGR_PEP_ID=MMETSP0308-20130426/85290_1 /TAXON_ID=38269 /ORGANISM="Gloeochaete witrockiana, Strain SAG 46.84" /LENGTH=393 /DNA_ID=CAMNT_0027118147 /DNA_START=83 /DNA_END=1264 /DNA_ORIENTATION=-